MRKPKADMLPRTIIQFRDKRTGRIAVIELPRREPERGRMAERLQRVHGFVMLQTR